MDHVTVRPARTPEPARHWACNLDPEHLKTFVALRDKAIGRPPPDKEPDKASVHSHTQRDGREGSGGESRRPHIKVEPTPRLLLGHGSQDLRSALCAGASGAWWTCCECDLFCC